MNKNNNLQDFPITDNYDAITTTGRTRCSRYVEYMLFLANVNSRSRSLYAVARPSVVYLLSVTLVHPTQAVQIFGNISTAFGTLAIH